MRTIEYNGDLIAKNSDAYRLWEEAVRLGKFEKLDRHLAEVTRRAEKLHGCKIGKFRIGDDYPRSN
jgi:hypothetical protein